ncbi:SixA phosphatase family protein [Arthrobacter monumenti]
MSQHHLKKLILLRHSKASMPGHVTDHERPLSDQGHADAPEAGKWLVEHNAVPDFILCSSALRARQTCTWICQELREKAPTAKLEDGLYDASETRILTLINHVPETVQSLLVITHLPAVQALALRLAADDSEEEAYTDVALSYPTGGISVLEHDLKWAELDDRDCRLTAFAAPRA